METAMSELDRRKWRLVHRKTESISQVTKHLSL